MKSLVDPYVTTYVELLDVALLSDWEVHVSWLVEVLKEHLITLVPTTGPTVVVLVETEAYVRQLDADGLPVGAVGLALLPEQPTPNTHPPATNSTIEDAFIYALPSKGVSDKRGGAIT